MMHAIVIRPLTWYPYKAGEEHAGLTPKQARSQSPSFERVGGRGRGGTQPNKNTITINYSC